MARTLRRIGPARRTLRAWDQAGDKDVTPVPRMRYPSSSPAARFLSSPRPRLVASSRVTRPRADRRHGAGWWPSGSAHAVGAGDLDDLVVDAQQQERRGPLADEQGPVPV